MIVGNKKDLAEGREVSFEEAQQLADNYGVGYMECSAKTGENVEEIFLALGGKMKEKFIDEPTSEELSKPRGLELDSQKTLKEKCCST